MKIWGYCRISTRVQNILRQERNILERYPNAVIVKEIFTGTKFQGRKELDKMLKMVAPNDTIVFDSVSRMCRNAEEGCELYEELFKKGVELIFLNEPHVNTSVYKQALDNQIKIRLETGNKATDDLINGIIETLNKFTIEVAKQQVRIAFEQAEKEVKDLHIRTSQGMLTAKLNGKQIGRAKGATFETKKGKSAKEIIKIHSKTFGGTLGDKDCATLAKVSRNSFYKYKREILEEMNGGQM